VFALSACAGPKLFRTPVVGFGSERYSAWFADERDGVIYFGLSPFWTALRAHGDPTADLAEPSAHLIGRFDVEREKFLPPLVATQPGPESRSSVWDVLAHPNGWIYYTTYFEEMGRVRPGTGEVEQWKRLGKGLNEIALGPEENLFVTRYAGAARAGSARDGSVVEISPEGILLREQTLSARADAVTAPKSIAVDPLSGDVWVNADVIGRDGAITFATFQLGADLVLKEKLVGSPELLFAAFAADGRGFFVEDRAGELWLRVVRAGQPVAELDLGARAPADFAQDIHFASDGDAAIAFWSGRVELVRRSGDAYAHASVTLAKPPECAGPGENAVFYSAFLAAHDVYATLYCDAAIARAPLPDAFRAERR
jgi:hypothetical protein